jgi:hypothetical protein
LIQKLLSISGNYVKFIPNDILSPENVMIAIDNDENCVKYLPMKYRENYVIAYHCVLRDGNLLKYFTLFNEDPEICRTAIINNGFAWFYISETMKEKKDLLFLAIDQNKNVLLLLNQNKTIFEKYKKMVLCANYEYGFLIQKMGECAICLETKNICILPCFQTHTICQTCMKRISRCPFCRKYIYNNRKIKIWT